MSKNTTSCIALALGIVVTSMLGACASTKEIDRTQRRSHISMRGPAFKRLVLTYNESNNLAYRADRYAKSLRDAGSVDPDTLLEAQELAADLAEFSDDIEWSLANLQRMNWHRTEMNGYWDRFLDLYPEDEAFADAFTDKEIRKPTKKLALKNQEEYRDLHEYEHHDAEWSTFFYPIGREVYKDQVDKQDQ